MKLFEILTKGIIELYDKSGNTLKGDISIDYFKSKYSSFDGETIRLFLNGIPLGRDGYRVKYECICGSINNILLQKYLMRNESSSCFRCRELNIDKIKTHSDYMKNTYNINGKVVKNIKKVEELSTDDLIQKSKLLFNNESDDYKEKYFKINTTIDEFNKHRDSIICINNIDIDSLEFIPYLSIRSHIKFTQYVKNNKNGKLAKFNNIVYICGSCDKEFLSSGRRLPKEKLSKHKILCKDCALCNRAFKIRNIKNIEGNQVVYQSKPELDLINFCNSNNIIIKNGPYLEYFFNNKKRTYRVDFEVNNMLIEIKGDHIWHRNQVKSGKWAMKEKAAKEYCIKNNKIFKLVFKKDTINIQKDIKI